MTSTRGDIQLLKKSLSTAINSAPPSEPEVFDILLALRKIPISIEILRETKIGSTVYDAKKKFPAASKCHNEARDIIAFWKKSCDIQADAGKASSASVPSNSTNNALPEVQKKTTLPVEKATDANENVDADDDVEVEKNYDSLSITRRKIMDLFTDHLGLSTIKINIAKFLSYNIEASINELHCSIGDSKSYIAKARSLSYNLKRNERLRVAILEGDLAPEDLVKLTPHELATDEQKDARDAESKASTLERRADYYQIARAGIQRANGIDPEAGGEYTCRKCKGNKTTHYSMQTRSADEPMTVFVGCLTCGNRWRCT